MLHKVQIPVGEMGNYKIERFTVTGKEFQGFGARYVPPGEYTRLMRGGQLVMSDTPDEMNDHYSFVRKAKGNVLIAGLGIGMVLYNLLEKADVTHVDVIEISEEVIALVAPWFYERYGDRIRIIHADILEYKPDSGIVYDFAWFDIWDDICVDNLETMKKLHRKYARTAKEKGSWAREICEYYRRRDKHAYWR